MKSGPEGDKKEGFHYKTRTKRIVKIHAVYSQNAFFGGTEMPYMVSFSHFEHLGRGGPRADTVKHERSATCDFRRRLLVRVL